MKYLILGRSGTGKDALATELEKEGLVQLKSYTTREKRTPSENTHIFIPREEAENFPNRAAETEINGVLYFATKEQVMDSDVYIIDPKGMYELLENMPDERMTVIYMETPEEVRRERALARAEDKTKELEIFNSRTRAEDAMFKEFEDVGRYEIKDMYAPTVKDVITINNDGRYSMKSIVAELHMLEEKETRPLPLREIKEEDYEL